MCKHDNFDANVVVQKITDTGGFRVLLHVVCKDCSKRMKFLGMPKGNFQGVPSISDDMIEARLPCSPMEDF